MKQIFKYLIVSILFFILGGVVVYLVAQHTNIITKNNHVAALEKAAEQKEKKMTGQKEKGSKKEAKEEEKKGDASDDKKDKAAKKSDDKDKKEGDGKKAGKDKKASTSAEYLRSLWLIKKRKAANVSGPQKGVLYMSGTSPYGPPAAYKDELFQETETLKISGAPQAAPPPPPLRFIPKPQRQSVSDPSQPTPTLFQIQVGRFSSLEKARKAKELMFEKGYKTVIYFTGTITSPGEFYLRLPETFFKHQAYQCAQTIAIKEKIVPSIVEKTDDINRLH